jgi:hypothetical protein
LLLCCATCLLLGGLLEDGLRLELSARESSLGRALLGGLLEDWLRLWWELELNAGESSAEDIECAAHWVGFFPVVPNHHTVCRVCLEPAEISGFGFPRPYSLEFGLCGLGFVATTWLSGSEGVTFPSAIPEGSWCAVHFAAVIFCPFDRPRSCIASSRRCSFSKLSRATFFSASVPAGFPSQVVRLQRAGEGKEQVSQINFTATAKATNRILTIILRLGD